MRGSHEHASGESLLIHFSGTEPIFRVYYEAADKNKVKPLPGEGSKLGGLT
jgi:phosphomannomutase